MSTDWQRPSIDTPTVAGGYLLLRSHAVLALWQAYIDGHITLLDVRTALAAAACRHSITVARTTAAPTRRSRGGSGDFASPGVPAEAVRRLTGCSDVRKIRAALRRLADAGVPPEQLGSRASSPLHLSVRTTAGVADRPVPVPRRWVRDLAAGGTAAAIAVCMAHLLRGSFLHRRQVRFGGTCSAAWVAEAFGINERTAKAARGGLVARGWLSPVTSPIWHRQRYGASFLLTVAATAVSASVKHVKMPARGSRSAPGLPPLRPAAEPGLSPPWEHKNLPLRGSENQNPAAGSFGSGPTGGGVHRVAEDGKASKAAPPTMVNIQPADFENPSRTALLFGDAQRRGLIGKAATDRLRFFTTVQHARSAGLKPAALLASLARRGCWHFGTQTDEDLARDVLRRLDGGSGTPVRSAPSGAGPSGLVGPREVLGLSRTAPSVAAAATSPLHSTRDILGGLGIRFGAV